MLILIIIFTVYIVCLKCFAEDKISPKFLIIHGSVENSLRWEFCDTNEWSIII